MQLSSPSTPSRASTRASSRAPSPSQSSNFHSSRRTSSSAASLRPNKLAPGSLTPTSASALPPHLSIPTSLHLDAGGSASSDSNLDVGPGSSEAILVKDTDADTEVGVEVGNGEEGEVVGHVESGMDEESRRTLRDQLRKTLSGRQADNDEVKRSPPRPAKGKRREVQVFDELVSPESVPSYPPRQYFVLTDAGKPVFISRGPKFTQQDPQNDEINTTSLVGVMQALISVFLDNDDKLRCIVAGPDASTRINFLMRSPLYYVCVSKWREPESVTRSHLEYLHNQILSIVTAAQLRRIFERRTNFDLGRLLSGTETFLHSLIGRLEFDLSISTSSLLCLNLDLNLRLKAAECLVPSSKVSKDILYVMLVARGRVVTLVRPKKHSVHPTDLHILLNTIHVPSILDSPASWLPICLPKYNSAGFLHAYVSFLRNEDVDVEADAGTKTPRASSPSSPSSPIFAPILSSTVANDNTSGIVGPDVEANGSSSVIEHLEERRTSVRGGNYRQAAGLSVQDRRLGVGLVCISGGGEFESIRSWFDDVVQKLDADHTLDSICSEIRSGKTEYSASGLGIPGLRHFIYKNRAQVQATIPVWEEPYKIDVDARRRLITLYQTLHDAIHAKSGQSGALKLQYIKTKHEGVMGWITQPFELYIALSPRLPKGAVISAANAVVKWVKKEEGRLFLRDAPTF